MKNLVLFLALLFISLSSFAQSFPISNSTKHKTILSTDYVSLTLANSQEQADCCNYINVSGYIEAVDGDSIQIRATKWLESKRLENSYKGYNLSWENGESAQRIAKSDVLYLERHRSTKHEKRKKNKGVIGGILLIAGLSTAANAIWVSDKSDKQNLLLAGGLQVSTGLILGLSSVPKEHYFKASNDPWRWGK